MPMRLVRATWTAALGGRRALLALSALACAAALAGSTSPAHAGGTAQKVRIVTVVKVRGIAWFDRMQQGIARFAARTGVDARMVGAATASPRSQVLLIRRVLAERPRPDAITVVPNSPASLEGVLGQARAAGVKVVTHEASNQRNTDVDIEAFPNAAYGAHLMDNLASCMGRKGTYVAFVGHRSARSHMEWVRGAYAEARRKYPHVTRLGGPIESLEHADVAYRKAKQLLTRYPHLGGFEGSSAVDVAGIGRAVREAGRQASTCVVGTSTPATVGSYLHDGSVDKISFWDPALAGEAQDALALRLIQGKPVGPGLDLHLPGYRSLKRIPGSPHGLAGSGWIDVTKKNAAKYPF
jgi:simple sugar transport system substrate-binding protein